LEYSGNKVIAAKLSSIIPTDKIKAIKSKLEIDCINLNLLSPPAIGGLNFQIF